MKKTICELFAGVGGFRLGFEKYNWETVYANQWEPKYKTQYAHDCYVSHFGINEIHSNSDISSIHETSIKNHTILVGGFPCQDYSVAQTKAKGIEGKKGVLWWEIYRIIKEKNPPFILLENVDRLLKSPVKQRGRDFGIILACLNNLGYAVEWRIINAADYGYSQRRRRIFIFGFHKETNYYKNLENHDDWIASKGFFNSEFPIIESNIQKPSYYSFNKTNNEIDILEVSNSFNFEFQNSGIMKEDDIYTCKTTPKENKSKYIVDILEKNVDEKYFIPDDKIPKWTYLKGPKAEDRFTKEGYKYTFREGGIPFPDPIDKPSRTMLTSEGKINRSTHVILDPTINKLRLLTPIECERLNGFPDNWTNTGMTESFRYFCMGNALVVNLIEQMANKLTKIIKKGTVTNFV